MAKFVIYSYKLHLDPNGVMGSLFTEEEALSPKETLLRKQELFQRIIDKDVSKERPFKCVRKSGRGVTTPKDYASRILWTQGDITFMQIENRREQPDHIDFQKLPGEDHPWCNVIIDNRKDIQHIAIQSNGAFSNTDVVAAILKDSFNDRLADYFLQTEIDAMYQSRAFWSVIERFKDVGIKMIQFDFDFPNLPWASDALLKLNEGAKKLGARPSAKFTATVGGRLLIDSDNKDEDIEEYTRACGGTGADILVQPNGNNALVHCKDDKEQRVQKQMPDELLDGAAETENTETTFQPIEEFVNNIKRYYD